MTAEKRIVYPGADGGIEILIPAQDSQIEHLIKAVPAGKPYKIVDVTDIPTDRTYRDAWEADFSNPDGFGGAE